MFAYKTYRRTHAVQPSHVGLEDLKRLCLELYALNRTARSNELNYFQKTYEIKDEDTDEIRANKVKALERETQNVDSHHLVSITVEGDAGEIFTIIPGEDLDQVFSVLNLPNRVKSIRLDNWAHYKAVTEKAPNFRIEVNLDFREYQIWPFQNAENSNESSISVSGLDETWVLGAIEKLRSSSERSSSLTANGLHRKIKYDFVLWIIGIPGTILLLKMALDNVEFLESWKVGLQVLIYLTMSLFILQIFRLFFNYLRWLFPYMELKEQPKKLQGFQRTIALFCVAGIVSGWLSLVASALIGK